MSRLGIEVRLDVSAREIATRSWNVLTSRLDREARLTVSTVAAGEGAVLLGRFQRLEDARDFHPGARRLRRASGGTQLWLAEGAVHVLLSLRSPDALVACTPASLVNRHVRPVLRAIGGAYFGRDWIAGSRVGGAGGTGGGRAPIAFAGFAHVAASGRAALEVVLPAYAGWCEPSRPSHRGLAPAHLDEPARFVDPILAAFEAAFGAGDRVTGEGADLGDEAPFPDPTPWSASTDEAMGPLRAGRDAGGTLQLGGEMFASADRLEALGAAVDADADAAGALVDAAFAGGGVIVGVNDLAHVRDVLLEARLQDS